ncbi:MAG TPA: O-antigen ligase [Rubrobacteraceae bacterium]|nr:O-antigen ligase [Rubrobacteraceae bacterium]
MFERCAVVFVFLLASTGLLLPLLHEKGGAAAQSAAQGDPVTQVVWFGVYAVMFLMFLVQWRRFLGIALKDRLLLLLTVVALASVLWAVSPEVTERRSVALIGSTLFGIYLASRFSLSEMLRLLAWAMGIAVVLSLLFVLALPSYGISGASLTQGDWQGIFGQKNTLGKNMALSITVFLILAMSSRSHRWIALSGIGLSSVLLLFSHSTTSLVVAVSIICLVPFFRGLRWKRTLAVSLVILTILLSGSFAIWFVSNPQIVLGALGKDTTLTGRTVLWSAVLKAIHERPWLGYGYSSFWLGWEYPSADVWLATRGNYYDSHNGILDLWLQLGFLGICIFALNFLRALLRAVAWVRATVTAEGIWPLAFLSFMLLSNLTEGTILQQNNLSWILYVATVFSIATPPRNPAGRSNNHSGVGEYPEPLERRRALIR